MIVYQVKMYFRRFLLYWYSGHWPGFSLCIGSAFSSRDELAKGYNRLGNDLILEHHLYRALSTPFASLYFDKNSALCIYQYDHKRQDELWQVSQKGM